MEDIKLELRSKGKEDADFKISRSCDTCLFFISKSPAHKEGYCFKEEPEVVKNNTKKVLRKLAPSFPSTASFLSCNNWIPLKKENLKKRLMKMGITLKKVNWDELYKIS